MSNKITYSSLKLSEEDHEAYEKALANFNLGQFCGLFVDGNEKMPFAMSMRDTLTDFDPSDTSRIVSRFIVPDALDIELAITHATSACKKIEKMGWERRLEILLNMQPLIANRAHNIAATLTYEIGKTRGEAYAEIYEVSAMIDAYKRFANEQNFWQWPLSDGMDAPFEKTMVSMQPLGGPVAIIGPFNFPFALVANSAMAAFLAGNPIIIKGSVDAPLAGLEWRNIMVDAGVPEEACLYLTGPGKQVGDALIRSRNIAHIGFTGSREIGFHISHLRAEMGLPNTITAEMGGKNAVVVTENANLEAAANGIIKSCIGFSGQKCSAVSRVYVARKIYRHLIAVLLEKARGQKIIVGDPKLRETTLGPLISAKGKNWHNRIGEIVLTQKGSIYKLSATSADGLNNVGHFVLPFMASDISHNHPVARDEHFTPFFTVHPVDTLEEAVNKVNDSPYGLCAGIFTTIEDEMDYFEDNVEAGVTYVNRRAGATTGAWPTIQAFGGWK